MLKILLTSLFYAAITLTLTFAQSKNLVRGNTPPEFSFKPISDETIKKIVFENSKGEVCLIDFWATWCAPCIETIPHLNKLIEVYKDKPVRFISITYEPEKLVNNFLEKHPMHSEVGLDTGFTMFRLFNGWAIPNIIMINSEGLLAGRIHPANLTESVINALLEGKIPEVKQTPEDLYNPDEAEKYFRSLLEKKK